MNIFPFVAKSIPFRCRAYGHLQHQCPQASKGNGTTIGFSSPRMANDDMENGQTVTTRKKKDEEIDYIKMEHSHFALFILNFWFVLVILNNLHPLILDAQLGKLIFLSCFIFYLPN